MPSKNKLVRVTQELAQEAERMPEADISLSYAIETLARRGAKMPPPQSPFERMGNYSPKKGVRKVKKTKGK